MNKKENVKNTKTKAVKKVQKRTYSKKKNKTVEEYSCCENSLGNIALVCLGIFSYLFISCKVVSWLYLGINLFFYNCMMIVYTFI